MSEAMIQSLGIASAKIVMLKEQLAESNSTIKKLQGERESWVKEVEQYQTDISKLNAKKFARFNNEDCWMYQDDGDDNIESLVCPVVISAEVLLKIKQQLAEKQAQIDTAAEMISEGLENEMSREQILIDVEKVLEGAKG